MNFKIKQFHRYKDLEESIYNFIDEFLVECQQCKGLAKIYPQNNTSEKYLIYRPRKLTCTNCSYTKYWQDTTVKMYQNGYDWYFSLPLWLKINCCGNILWAFNTKHLLALENYIGSTLRESKPNRRGTIASCLPHWMISAKHRGELLKCISKLKGKKIN